MAEECVKVTESERCELVLNAVFNWEPVEFVQKRCDMITLRVFFKMSRAAFFWIFCMRAICSSATPANVAVQLSNLDVIIDATSFSMELSERNGRIEAILLSARNVVRQRLLMRRFTDSVWSRCTPRYVTVI